MRCDAHIHLSLFPDREQLLLKLLQEKCLPIGVSCDLADASINKDLATKIPFPFLVGIHPWYAKADLFSEDLFLNLLNASTCIGIGECGLDANIDNSIQIPILRQQLDLASRLNLPVSLHVYKQHDQMLKILKSYAGKLSGLIHGFTSSKEIARAYLDQGFYLSFGRNFIQQRSKIPELLKFIPQDRILLESDADYKNSMPYDFELIDKQYALLSSLLKLSFFDTEALLYNNLCTLFLGKKHDLRLFGGKAEYFR